MRALRAQVAAEVRMTLRRGESLLVAVGIPAGLLVFFSLVDVLPTPAEDPVDFLAPGVLALAVMSTAMVSLGIATAFERHYLVLKRLGTTPLGRGRLLTAKTVAVIAVEILQVAALAGTALVLGWRPAGVAMATLVVAMVLGTAAFAGIGLGMAGALPAHATLAGANGLYIVLLLLGGMMIPLRELPAGMRVVAELLPAAALSDVLHAAFAANGAAPGRAWLVLAFWAVAAPVTAALTFRWE